MGKVREVCLPFKTPDVSLLAYFGEGSRAILLRVRHRSRESSLKYLREGADAIIDCVHHSSCALLLAYQGEGGLGNRSSSISELACMDPGAHHYSHFRGEGAKQS